MSDCCDNFTTTAPLTATRVPNCIVRTHDDCGYKASYKGKASANFPEFVPVKFGTAPGELEPALDGVDAIGIASGELLAATVDRRMSVYRNVAEISWSCMAPAVGALPTDAAAWWAIHKELAKVGIFVTF
jgi:hypothetical protein